jgi:hypothetical protein
MALFWVKVVIDVLEHYAMLKYSFTILDLRTRWRSEVRFTLVPAGPIFECQIKLSTKDWSPPFLLLDSQVIQPYQEISYNLVLSGPSPRP